MPHKCVSELGLHCSAPSHYLNQCWPIVNWTPRNKLQWQLHHRNTQLFVHENVFENVVCQSGGHFVQGKTSEWEHCKLRGSYWQAFTNAKWFICTISHISKKKLNLYHQKVRVVYLLFLYFDICNYTCLDTSYHFSALSLLLKYCSLFFQVLLF